MANDNSLPGNASFANRNNLDTSTFQEENGTQKQAIAEDRQISMDELLRITILENATSIDENNMLEISYMPKTNFTSITFVGSGSFSDKATVNIIYIQITQILESIQPIIDTNVRICVQYPLTDLYGNSSINQIVLADYSLGTIQKINFDRFNHRNISSVADEWWNHQALNIE